MYQPNAVISGSQRLMSQLSTLHGSKSRLNQSKRSPEKRETELDQPTKRRKVLGSSSSSSSSSDTPIGERAPLFPPAILKPEAPTRTARIEPPKAADVLGFVRSKLSAHHPHQLAPYVDALRQAYLALHPTASSHELDHKLEPETHGLEEELKLWLARAEVGLMVLDAAAECDVNSWTRIDMVQDRVDQAVGKGLVLVQKDVSLRSFKLPFTIAGARLSVLQNDFRQALALLRRQVTTALPIDPPAQTYRAHLALVGLLLEIESIDLALISLVALADLAGRNGDTNIQTLCKVERLRILATADRWTEAIPALKEAEDALGLAFADDHPTPLPPSTSGYNPPSVINTGLKASEPELPKTPWCSVLQVYTLMLGSMVWTHAGHAARTSARVALLHRVMDFRVSWMTGGQASRDTTWQYGTVDIPLGSSSDANTSRCALTIQSTHPAALFRLTFLTTAASKRDPVLPTLSGRELCSKPVVSEPKRRTFAREGLSVAERAGAVDFAPCTPLAHARNLEDSCTRMRAQLLLELVNVALSRHELDEAEDRLVQLITYLRNTSVGPPARPTSSESEHGSAETTLWSEFAPMICLLAGSLAQAQLRPRRASASYRAAINLAEGDLNHVATSLAARAADLAARIGLAADSEEAYMSSASAPTSMSNGTCGETQKGPTTTTLEQDEECWPALTPPSSSEVEDLVAALSKHSTAALQAVGHVIVACAETSSAPSQLPSSSSSADISKTKNHLKIALELCTSAHDNALRVEVLALMSALYMYTAPAHAHLILRRAKELAKELGASGLGAWIVQQLIEISRLNGKESRVPKLKNELIELEEKTRQLYNRPWLGMVGTAAV